MSFHHDTPDHHRPAPRVADFPGDPHSTGGPVGPETGILAHIESYWQSLRDAGGLPARNQIAPHLIDRALPHAFILQRVAPGVARMRVAGQRIHDLLRMDPRGMPFSVLFATDSRAPLSDLVERAFTQPAIIAATLTAPAQLFTPALQARLLLLPLRGDRGNSDRVLGALVASGEPGPRARRFALTAGAPVRSEQVGPGAWGAARPALRLVVNNG